MDGELFVSFWNSGDDYAMMTESEFDEYLQNTETQTGGMQICVYAECPYEPGKLTVLRRGTAK